MPTFAAECIAGQAAIKHHSWVRRKIAYLEPPWVSDNARSSLLIDTPASFRQRGVFTIPKMWFDYAVGVIG